MKTDTLLNGASKYSIWFQISRKIIKIREKAMSIQTHGLFSCCLKTYQTIFTKSLIQCVISGPFVSYETILVGHTIFNRSLGSTIATHVAALSHAADCPPI